MNNFTVADLSATDTSLLAMCVIQLCTGMALGWLTNIFAFRRRCLFRQISYATLIGLAITPIEFNLALISGGMSMAAGAGLLNIALAVAVACINAESLSRQSRHLAMQFKRTKWILAACIVLTLLVLIDVLDLACGHNLYISTVATDQSNMVGFTDSILRYGLPLVNPTFFPGRAEIVAYHYFWPLICAVTTQIAQQGENTRPTIIASVIWSGMVFLNLISFATRYFFDARNAVKAVKASLALLLVGNLSGVVLAFLLVARHQYGGGLNWWNRDAVLGNFVEIIPFMPHHIAALCAGLFGSILVLSALSSSARMERLICALLAGSAASATAGLSVYVFITICGAWCLWLTVQATRRETTKTDLLTLLIIVVLTAALSLPMISQTVGHASQGSSFGFAVRRCDLLNFLIADYWYLPKLVFAIINFLCLPLTYILGLGFILLGTLCFWQNTNVRHISFRQRLLGCLAISGILIGSFTTSSRLSNELAKDAILLLAFPCLLWSGQYVASKWNGRCPELSLASWSLIVAGVFTSSCSLWLQRTELMDYYKPDFLFSVRSVYETLHNSTPRLAILQHNPRCTFNSTLKDLFAMLYSHRQSVISEHVRGLLNGPDWRYYNRVGLEVDSLFAGEPTALSEHQGVAICRKYGISVVVVKDTDPIWKYRQPWYRNLPLMADYEHARAYAVSTQR